MLARVAPNPGQAHHLAAGAGAPLQDFFSPEAAGAALQDFFSPEAAAALQDALAPSAAGASAGFASPPQPAPRPRMMPETATVARDLLNFMRNSPSEGRRARRVMHEYLTSSMTLPRGRCAGKTCATECSVCVSPEKYAATIRGVSQGALLFFTSRFSPLREPSSADFKRHQRKRGVPWMHHARF